MYQNKKAVLVFGVGPLQKSIIKRAKLMGLFTVGIDPVADATCRDAVDAFVVVGGQDYEGTCAVVERYGIDAIVTAATDKPLVMMARIAEKYGFPFYSVETAQWSTDKLMMKQRFIAGNVPHAKGITLSRDDMSQLPLAISHWPLAGAENGQQPTANSQQLYYPVIVKPRDNSGSRGVKLCRNAEELKASIDEALENSKLDTVLVEEFIEGPEYSIEGLHYDGNSEVIQFTEKKTTEFPYNVELGHKQPANLSEKHKAAICQIVSKIGKAMNFVNSPSHTELKINDRGIFVIETSPRLGGDYITSTLTPLSTGINLEDQLLHIALGEVVDTKTGRVEKASGVHFFCLPEGRVEQIGTKALEEAKNWPGIYSLNIKLKEGDEVHQITSSLNRYGEFIVKAADRKELDGMMDDYANRLSDMIMLKS